MHKHASNSYEGHLRDIMINPTYPGVNDGTMTSATGFFTNMAVNSSGLMGSSLLFGRLHVDEINGGDG
jgi:hypothetical protein